MPEGSKSFSLHYVGDTRPSAMDARDLIQILISFSNLSLKASRTFYGADARTSFRIEHVQPGTIDIQRMVELLAAAQPGFAMLPSLSFGVSDIPHLIKAWLDLLKFLKGAPAQKVQNVDNGNALQIENVEGNLQVVNGNIYNTFIFNNVGKDAAKLQTPAKYGARKLQLMQGKRPISSYTPEDLEQFKPIKPTAEPIISEIEAAVEVISPVLEGEGVWKFRDGRMVLTAKLLDEEYRARVVRGEESFTHGDRLRVTLKTIQENLANKIATKHLITKVIGRL